MAIRDEKMNWTPEAHELDKALIDALKPTLEVARGLELTLEDWFYMVSYVAQDLIIDIALSNKGWIKK